MFVRVPDDDPLDDPLDFDGFLSNNASKAYRIGYTEFA